MADKSVKETGLSPSLFELWQTGPADLSDIASCEVGSLGESWRPLIDYFRTGEPVYGLENRLSLDNEHSQML